MSGASRNRAFHLGVNGSCADLDALGLGSDSFLGPQSEAPAAVTAARLHVAANFYAESVDVELALDENAQAGVLDANGWHPGLLLSPYHFDLPTALLTPEGTRRF